MINKKIAELILRAQNASDGGKQIQNLVWSRKSYRDNCAGYPQKDNLIFAAINLIVANKGKCDFKFSVVYDNENVADYIVYFEAKPYGIKTQVSFHSFDKRLERFIKKSFRIKWDRNDSRQSAVTMYQWYCSGEYISAEEI